MSDAIREKLAQELAEQKNLVRELAETLTLCADGLDVATSTSAEHNDFAFLGYALAANKARAVLAKVKP